MTYLQEYVFEMFFVNIPIHEGGVSVSVWSCTHVQKIRRSIIALIVLFFMGLGVLAASFTLFDGGLKTPNVPKSMLEQPIEPCKDILPIFLIIVAALALPFGAYIMKTLADCERQAHQPHG
jgi:hypothetical protein